MINSRRIRWAGFIACIEEKRNACRILVVTPEGKRLLGKPRRSLEDNNKMHFREIGWGGMDFIDLAEDRSQWKASANAVMNVRKFVKSCTTGGFSRRAQLHEVSLVSMIFLAYGNNAFTDFSVYSSHPNNISGRLLSNSPITFQESKLRFREIKHVSS
jgi:hypothetical protein